MTSLPLDIPRLAAALLLTTSLTLTLTTACGEEDNATQDNSTGHNAQDNAADTHDGACDQHTDAPVPSNFLADGLLEEITEEPCTLSDGSASTCYKITIQGAPSNHEIGPFCPRHISDDASAGGKWFDGGVVYDVDGEFIKNLSMLYDDTWMLYDEETGDIRVTLTAEECELAARPNVAEEYRNHCVECQLDQVGGAVSREVLIPKTPTLRSSPAEIGSVGAVGIALNGVRFDPPAPVDAILAANTIAAFDDCGGHVNPFDGYHYHGALGCSDREFGCDGHAPLIGYAMDGFAIYALLDEDGNEPTDLDECRGQTDDVRGYHYHAASAGENMFIGCFKGLTVATEGDTTNNVMEPPNSMTGGDGMNCAEGQASMCCGDGVCDGPETAETCAADCG